MALRNRRPSVTTKVGRFAATVSFDPSTGHPIEVFITDRGVKVGEWLDEALYNLGVEVSKIMQKETIPEVEWTWAKPDSPSDNSKSE